MEGLAHLLDSNNRVGREVERLPHGSKRAGADLIEHLVVALGVVRVERGPWRRSCRLTGARGWRGNASNLLLRHPRTRTKKKKKEKEEGRRKKRQSISGTNERANCLFFSSFACVLCEVFRSLSFFVTETSEQCEDNVKKSAKTTTTMDGGAFDTTKQIGVLFTGVSVLFFVAGILLLFDPVLVLMANILFICGVCFIVGFQRVGL